MTPQPQVGDIWAYDDHSQILHYLILEIQESDLVYKVDYPYIATLLQLHNGKIIDGYDWPLVSNWSFVS